MKRLLFLIMLLAAASPCLGMARYAQKKEMIKEAESIVIVEITKIDDEILFEMKETPLDDVIQEINALVEEQMKETPKPAQPEPKY